MGIFKTLFGFSDKCSACGAEVNRGAGFCPQCGVAIPGARVVCPACGQANKGTAKFCSQCRTPLMPKPEAEAATDQRNRWKRPLDEFARRIETGDLNTLLQPGLVVEPGTQALIFQAGVLAATVSQGAFDLSRPLPGVDAAVPATAIVMDAGDTTLSLLYSELRSREDVPVDVIVAVTVALADAVALYTNLMHGRESLAVTALADMVWAAGANVVQARLRSAGVNELDGNLQLKADLERDLRTHMDTALQRNGLRLIDLRFVEFQSPMYEKVRQRRAETFVAQERIADAEQRAVLNQRLRDTLTRERLHKFTTATDFEQFVRQTEHELGLKQVIRREEMEELKRTYENKRDDDELARKHLLEKLELEQDLAMRRLNWSGERDKLDHQIEQQRKSLQAQQQMEWSKFQQELQARGSLREESVADARSKAEEVRIKMGLAGEALDLRAKRAAQEHDEQSRRIQREQEEKDRDSARLRETQELVARHEQERIRALSEAEQARLAADLKKTEIFQGMSEEQILALMAKDSPHVAEAIAERARAQAQTKAASSEEVKALYERVLAGKESEADRLERIMGQLAGKESEADRLERIMGQALGTAERIAGASAAKEREQKAEVRGALEQSMDRLGDVATARAGTPAVAASGERSSADVVCPDCHRQSPAGSKFCENCGHQFYK